MERITLDVGAEVKVIIDAIGGDLRVTGRGEGRFEAQAAEDAGLNVRRDGDDLRVTCRSGCLIFLPSEARIDAGQVGGDVRITNVMNEIMIRDIGGDVSLRRLQRVTFKLVGGDLHARHLEGDLTVDRIGGDAVVERVQGELRMPSVGGDVMLKGVSGLLDVKAGGDVSLRYEPQKGVHSEVTAGGDLSCTLMEGASVGVHLQAGGDVHTQAPLQTAPEEGYVVELGEGDGKLALTAGGDLWLRTGAADFSEDLIGEVMGEVDAKIAEMEARFGAMGAGVYAFEADRIGERVRRAVERVQRKASKARRKAAFRGGPRSATFSFGGFTEPTQPVTDEERMRILKMVEEGTITVDEAETLLQALEGES
jgi:hypothetical protein